MAWPFETGGSTSLATPGPWVPGTFLTTQAAHLGRRFLFGPAVSDSQPRNLSVNWHVAGGNAPRGVLLHTIPCLRPRTTVLFILAFC